MKTAPFNLEKALAGEPLVTRACVFVEGFWKRKNDDDLCAILEEYPYAAQISGNAYAVTYDKNGFQYTGEEHMDDLFMLVTEQKHKNNKMEQEIQEEEKPFEVWEELGFGCSSLKGEFQTEEDCIKFIREVSLKAHKNHRKHSTYKITLEVGHYVPVASVKTSISLKKIK